MLYETLARLLTLAMRCMPSRWRLSLGCRLYARYCVGPKGHRMGWMRYSEAVGGQHGLVGRARRCVLCGAWAANASDILGYRDRPVS